MKRVLIVEDDALIRADIQSILEDEGYAVVTAASSAEALARLSEAEVSLILLDLGLPVTSGADFRKLQLAVPGCAGIPVVLLSGDSELKERAERLGAAGYLRKPFGIKTLLDVVARFSERPV